MVKFKIRGVIVGATHSSQDVLFFVVNPFDAIQSHHAKGVFYELEELTLMSRYMSPDTAYLDIGANVGNHIIYFSKCLGLHNIIAIEPNPRANAILKVNLRLNDIEEQVDTSLLGLGLSDHAGSADVFTPRNNLGGARLFTKENGALKLATGDQLLADRTVDFVKMDVEGMEMQCLQGMSDFIDRCRPTMFIEVDNANITSFQQWCNNNRYAVADTYRRYEANENYLILPKECT
jgi:FkbM family methyltransferase